MSSLNTRHNTSVRSVIFQENGEWFGVALEFNIVETGTSPQEVFMLLDEAVVGYIEAAQKSNFPITAFHQEINPEYELLWSAGNLNDKRKDSRIYKVSTQLISR